MKLSYIAIGGLTIWIIVVLALVYMSMLSIGEGLQLFFSGALVFATFVLAWATLKLRDVTQYLVMPSLSINASYQPYEKNIRIHIQNVGNGLTKLEEEADVKYQDKSWKLKPNKPMLTPNDSAYLDTPKVEDDKLDKINVRIRYYDVGNNSYAYDFTIPIYVASHT